MGKLFWLLWLLNSFGLCAQYLAHSQGFKELWTSARINHTWYKAHHHNMTQEMDFTEKIFYYELKLR